MESQPMSTAFSAIVATAVAVTTGLVAPLPSAVTSHAEKPEKFTGVNYKQWQQNMFFYLTTLNLARFLSETVPHVDEGATDALSAKTAKELWESLDCKYKTEDAGTKKFVVAKFLDFKTIDSKTVMSQVQHLQVVLHDIHAEGMSLSETFQVSCIIEKLPPSWVDFKNYLKHKRKEMTIEDLVGKNGGKKNNGKGFNLGPKGGVGKKKKFQGTCYNCGKQGHRANECKLPKKENA
ncbi:uncharacterized protein LOC143567527 [Bidens hawaiensis]|uniref:uncharacterized protein LOC143567527 n=1 Tax=Bidens hawaiensis TaxID=980011 RepID=UPI00404A2F61